MPTHSLPSIAILGPTASGKSSLAVAVAKRIGGIVVNGDPFQAYEGLTIGAGQPSEDEQGGVPHVGYGALPLSMVLNPSEFGARVRQWLSASVNPVLVTGSGLYLRGIWDQLSALPDVPDAMVQRVRGWERILGPRALHRYLAAVDGRRASELHPNDRSRIQRALALHLATGDRPSGLLDGIERGLPTGWKALVVLPSRDQQRLRVERRVAAMVAAGWREEVRRLVTSGLEAELRRVRPLGYEAWLDGTDPVEIQAAIVQATQAYAKRQATFFRNQWPNIPVWDPDQEGLAEALSRLGLESLTSRP